LCHILLFLHLSDTKTDTCRTPIAHTCRTPLVHHLSDIHHTCRTYTTHLSDMHLQTPVGHALITPVRHPLTLSDTPLTLSYTPLLKTASRSGNSARCQGSFPVIWACLRSVNVSKRHLRKSRNEQKRAETTVLERQFLTGLTAEWLPWTVLSPQPPERARTDQKEQKEQKRQECAGMLRI